MRTGHALVSPSRLGLALAAALALTAGASPPRDFVSDHLAGPLLQIHGSGNPETLKVLFLGDGFIAADDSMGTYRAAVEAMAAELLATEPFQTLSDSLSIYRMDVISDGAGIDVPVSCPEGSTEPTHQYNQSPAQSEASRFSKTPDNALDTRWCAADVLGHASSKTMLNSGTGRISEFVLASGITPDLTVVVVNDFWYGASAYQHGDLMYISIGSNLLLEEKIPGTEVLHVNLAAGTMARVFVHEFGHLNPFGLLDEYSTGRDQGDLPDVSGVINYSANLSTEVLPGKWVGLGATGVEIVCPDDNAPEVGAVLGGYGFAGGVYHTRCDCRMNEPALPISFCLVCRDRIYTGLTEDVGPINPLEVPRQLPNPWWVILDGLQIRSGVSGKYSLEYAIAAGGETINGVWPPRSPVLMEPGRTIEPGALLGILPPGTSGPMTISYKLYRSATAAGRDGSRMLVDQMTGHPIVTGLRPGIFTLNRPSFRMTIALTPGR